MEQAKHAPATVSCTHQKWVHNVKGLAPFLLSGKKIFQIAQHIAWYSHTLNDLNCGCASCALHVGILLAGPLHIEWYNY